MAHSENPFEVLTPNGSPMPFVVAEMSANHSGKLEKALRIVDAASAAGAHAIKLQTYTPDSMTLDLDKDEFRNNDPHSPWFGRKLYDLYREAHTPRAWHQELIDRALENGILWFSSPFDESSVDFLEGLGAPAYKIASFESIDLPLIAYVASTGKPLVISTGMASLEEIGEAVETVRSVSLAPLVLLHCSSTYPALPEEANLRTIADMRRRFQVPVGFSDHSLGTSLAIAAASLDAVLIEKHLTIHRGQASPDSSFSMEPDEFGLMVSSLIEASDALGQVQYGPTAREVGAKMRRRSIYIAEPVQQGEELTTSNLRRVRPGGGLAPKHYFDVLGRRASRNLEAGTPLDWNLIE